MATANGESDRAAEVAEGVGPEECATRRFSKHSKDHRPDLPPGGHRHGGDAPRGSRCGCGPSPATPRTRCIIRKVKDDLGGWSLNRVIWALDRGFNSAENRRYLQRGGGHYIVGEQLRGRVDAEAAAALAARAATRRSPATCEVKEVASTTAPHGTASSSATTPTRRSATRRCATRSSPD